MGAARRGLEEDGAPPGAASLGRLALSKQEAAEALGVSVDFFEEHVMHELRIVRRGRRRLIPVRELERWLDESATCRGARTAAGTDARSTRGRRLDIADDGSWYGGRGIFML